MPSTGLDGPYPLTQPSITKNVTKKSPGAYALGKTENNTFYVSYVGRGDTDVADRLADHIGEYDEFKFGYFSSAKTAFEKECNLYHDFSGLDNKIHPARPDNSNWKCPRCTVFG